MWPNKDVPPDEPRWRMDALDARAGLAFASWRPDRDFGGDAVADAPCLYFSPPFFRPESVASSALAWGATRGCFAPELRVGDQEAWFQSPDDVAEFVRRSYVSGGAGDGSDGDPPDGGPLPTPPVDGPPSRNYRGENEAGAKFTERVMGRIRTFRGAISDARLGQVLAFDWAIDKDESAGQALIGGAMSALVELLRRKPSSEGDPLRRWALDTAFFFQVAGPAGLFAARRRWAYSRALEEHTLHEADFFDYFIHRSLHGYIGPLQSLRRMPVPDFARAMIPEDVSDNASLYHLLNAFVASPHQALDHKRNDEIIELVLFASAVVVSANHRSAGFSQLQLILAGPYGHDRYADELAEQAYRWLVEHLPSRAFTKDLELAIAGCQSLRYRRNAAVA